MDALKTIENGSELQKVEKSRKPGLKSNPGLAPSNNWTLGKKSRAKFLVKKIRGWYGSSPNFDKIIINLSVTRSHSIAVRDGRNYSDYSKYNNYYYYNFFWAVQLLASWTASTEFISSAFPFPAPNQNFLYLPLY